MAAPRWEWLGDGDWDRIVRASPGATGFHGRAWSQAIAAWDSRFTPRALGVELDDGELAALPLFVRKGALRRGPFSRAVSSHPSVYGGPIAATRLLRADDWRRVLDGLRRSRLGRLECFGNPLQPVPTNVALASTRVFTTHTIELASLPQVASASYKNGCRYQVRQARNLGVTVERTQAAKDVHEYFAIYEDSLRRWGKDAGDSYPRSLFEALIASDAAELWCARAPDGRMAAGGLFLFSRGHAVHWHGAMLEELSKLRAPTALQDALIEHARTRGCRLYDFNPSGSLEGVRTFKESFGSRPTEVTAWRHVPAWIARLRRTAKKR